MFSLFLFLSPSLALSPTPVPAALHLFHILVHTAFAASLLFSFSPRFSLRAPVAPSYSRLFHLRASILVSCSLVSLAAISISVSIPHKPFLLLPSSAFVQLFCPSPQSRLTRSVHTWLPRLCTTALFNVPSRTLFFFLSSSRLTHPLTQPTPSLPPDTSRARTLFVPSPDPDPAPSSVPCTLSSVSPVAAVIICTNWELFRDVNPPPRGMEYYIIRDRRVSIESSTDKRSAS